MRPTTAKAAHSKPATGRGRTRSRVPRWRLWLGLAVLIAAGPAMYVINRNWPYRYRNVEPLLENVFASNVKIDKYHRTYFPRPGFVATGLTLQRKSTDTSLPPLGHADHLIVQGGWLDLLMLRHRVELVDVKGLHIVLPPAGTQQRQEDFPSGSSADFTGSTTAIDKLVLHNAILEIQRSSSPSLLFPIQKLIVRNMQQGKTMHYWVDMQNPIPTGHIVAAGNFGPLTPKNLGNTPLSGDFKFDQVQLSDLGNLQGQLRSSDHFEGTLAAINARVHTETPDFAVGDGTPTDLKATLTCTIDGLNGDVFLHEIAATLGATPINVRGSIAGSPRKTVLDVSVPRGRVQDLLRPFLQDRPPLAGAVALHAHAELLPGGKGATFAQRFRMDSSFDLPAEQITNRAEEQKLSSFSERAQGDKSPKKQKDQQPQDVDVLSSLRGTANIRDGVVSTEGLQFSVAGASAVFHGTYSLQNKNVRMEGTLRMDSDISHVTTGFRSMLLKPFAPFFKRKHAGAVIPVAITGSTGHYSVSQNLLHDK